VKKYERFLSGRLYFLVFSGKIYKSFIFIMNMLEKERGCFYG